MPGLPGLLHLHFKLEVYLTHQDKDNPRMSLSLRWVFLNLFLPPHPPAFWDTFSLHHDIVKPWICCVSVYVAWAFTGHTPLQYLNAQEPVFVPMGVISSLLRKHDLNLSPPQFWKGLRSLTYYPKFHCPKVSAIRRLRSHASPHLYWKHRTTWEFISRKWILLNSAEQTKHGEKAPFQQPWMTSVAPEAPSLFSNLTFGLSVKKGSATCFVLLTINIM